MTLRASILFIMQVDVFYSLWKDNYFRQRFDICTSMHGNDTDYAQNVSCKYLYNFIMIIKTFGYPLVDFLAREVFLSAQNENMYTI
jgi:hypothetical protein